MKDRTRVVAGYLTLVTLFALAVCAAGCGQDTAAQRVKLAAGKAVPVKAAHLTKVASALRRLTVTPARASIPAGSTRRFVAIGTFSDGTRRDVTGLVGWTSSAPGLCSVTSQGLARAGLERARVRATVGSVSGVATVTVGRAHSHGPTLIHLAVLPPRAVIYPGTTTLRYRAVGSFSDGSHRDLTSQVKWSTSNPKVATIIGDNLGPDPAGQVAVVKTPGQCQTVQIRASLPGSTIGTVAARLRIGPLPAANGRSRAFVYVVDTQGYNGSPGDVAGCVLDPGTGRLTYVHPPRVATGNDPCSVAVDARGRFLYVVNRADKTVSGFTIDGVTGGLTHTSPATFATGRHPCSVAVDPGGRFVYVANGRDNTVSGFAVDRVTGVLTPTDPPTFSAGRDPCSLAVSPHGRFLYVADHQGAVVSGYVIDQATGKLTPTRPATFATGESPCSVAIGPQGQYAYVADEGNGLVSGYVIDQATGKLTPTRPATFATGIGPCSVAVDPRGRFLYVADAGDKTVSGFAIDGHTGGLVPISPATFTTPGTPRCAAVDPGGQFLYVVEVLKGGASNTAGFEIDPDTGTLFPTKPVAFGTGAAPWSVAIAPYAHGRRPKSRPQSPRTRSSRAHPRGRGASSP